MQAQAFADTSAADSALYVQFYEREFVIPFESEREGRPIMKMMDWVKIQVPGNNLLTIDTLADASHKRRFPQQWAIYQQNKANDQVQGTLLTAWPAINAAQAMEMRHFKFYTVEQIADSSDHNLVHVAAIAGTQPAALKDKAIKFLNQSKQSAAQEQVNFELQKRDDQIKALTDQVNLLMSKLEAPKRGRPAKETEAE